MLLGINTKRQAMLRLDGRRWCCERDRFLHLDGDFVVQAAIVAWSFLLHFDSNSNSPFTHLTSTNDNKTRASPVNTKSMPNFSAEDT
jgi:hypothetical protein